MGNKICPVFQKCGGCSYRQDDYGAQVLQKEKEVKYLLSAFVRVEPMIEMEEPYFYRHKVNGRFAQVTKTKNNNRAMQIAKTKNNRAIHIAKTKSSGRSGQVAKTKIICGRYSENSHRVIECEECLIEDKRAQTILKTLAELVQSFKMTIYNENQRRGLFRYAQIRTGWKSDEIMLTLVLADHKFPSKNNFIKALLKLHPEITTIVQNVNERNDSAVLAQKEKTIYGPGFIYDSLSGIKFRISSRSFYQVNPKQTEKLYETGIKMLNLKGNETVLDAYCGIGTISLFVAKKAKEVIGVENNADAVRDAISNAKFNGKKCSIY